MGKKSKSKSKSSSNNSNNNANNKNQTMEKEKDIKVKNGSSAEQQQQLRHHNTNNDVVDDDGKEEEGIPFLLVDMTKEEYDDLCNQIKELSKEEIEVEWMESCRHGEIDILRALINTTTTTTSSVTTNSKWLTNYRQPTSGNTGLHMACANNHLHVVKYLIEELHHPFTTNVAKNTPLHWAASNGSADVVEYLLTSSSSSTTANKNGSQGTTTTTTTTKGLKGLGLESIDVLAQNAAGRSALTEGFSSQNEAVVKAILEHDSASEEKLLSAGVPVPVPDDNDKDNDDPTTIDKDSNSDMLASHIHHFFDVVTVTDDDSNTNKNDDDNEKPPPSSKSSSSSSSLIKIRELAMKNADNPFADDDRPDQDTTGLSIWSASLVCARWMIDLCRPTSCDDDHDDDDVSLRRQRRRRLFDDVVVVVDGDDNIKTSSNEEDEQKKQPKSTTWTALELGSGCGVPGLALAASLLRNESAEAGNDLDGDRKSNHHRSVKRKFFVTDLNPQTVDNLKYNIELNGLSPHVEASVMDWDNPESWPSNPDSDNNNNKNDDDDDGTSTTSPTHGLYDVVVGSDLIYQKSLVPLLKSVIQRTVKPGGTFLYVCPDTGRDGLDEFINEMKTLCPKWTERVAPKEYHANPLVNGDEEECFMHFNELFQKTFVLYEFPF